jgi:integrase
MIKPPRSTRIPDIISVDEAQQLFLTTRRLSYRVFFFIIYSLGLRLGEGRRVAVGDIDAPRMRVHIRNAKGNKDRLVPLPLKTLTVLRRFWSLHRHPVFLFPNRKRGLASAHLAESPLDRGGIQVAMKGVVQDMGLKKTFHAILYAIVTPLIYSKRESIY